jgi:hypothetical protein
MRQAEHVKFPDFFRANFHPTFAQFLPAGSSVATFSHGTRDWPRHDEKTDRSLPLRRSH